MLVPVTKDRVRLLPRFASHLARFSYDVRRLTDDFEPCSGDVGDGGMQDLTAFLSGICQYIAEDLFGVGGETRELRTHFRMKADACWEGFLVMRGSHITDEPISSIPIEGDSLIARSYSLKRSLVASADPEHVYRTGSVWEDFFTYAFRDIGEDSDVPILSFGVSLKYSEQHQDFLYLMSYCGVEEILQECVGQFHEAYGMPSLREIWCQKEA